MVFWNQFFNSLFVTLDLANEKGNQPSRTGVFAAFPCCDEPLQSS